MNPETAVRKARVRLVAAIQSYAASFGEAQRINGMRLTKQDDDALYQREMAQWTRVSHFEEQKENALRAYTRALRKAMVTAMRKRR
jgi:hypothetical protein